MSGAGVSEYFALKLDGGLALKQVSVSPVYTATGVAVKVASCDEERSLSYLGANSLTSSTVTLPLRRGVDFAYPQCKDGINGTNYCSQWCGPSVTAATPWGCSVGTDGGYTCSCEGCNTCQFGGAAEVF